MNETGVEETRRKAALAELAEVLGEEWASDDPVFGASWGRDVLSRVDEPTYYPDIVVLPHTSEEVAEIMRIANRHGLEVQVAAGGANTFTSIMMQNGGILVDTRRFDRILEIDEDSMTATVECGVPHSVLLTEAMSKDLCCDVPGAPSSTSATANICNQGGEHFHNTRYNFGNTKMLGIELVTPTGEIVRTGHLAFPDGKAGMFGPDWDLSTLAAASAGLAGIITKAVLKLFPLGDPVRRRKQTEFGLFRDLGDAVEAMAELGAESLGTAVGEAGPIYYSSALPSGSLEDHLKLLNYISLMATTAVWVDIEGTEAQVEYQRRRVDDIFEEHDADRTLNDLLDLMFNEPVMAKEACAGVRNVMDVYIPEHWVKRLSKMMRVSETPAKAHGVGGNLLVGTHSAGIRDCQRAWRVFDRLMRDTEFPGYEEGWWSSYGTMFRGGTAKIQELDVHFDRLDPASCDRRDEFVEMFLQACIDEGVPTYMHFAAFGYLAAPPSMVLGDKGAEMWLKLRALLDPNRIMHRHMAYDRKNVPV
jgi:FAD/FMN-containing dehydrogenase